MWSLWHCECAVHCVPGSHDEQSALYMWSLWHCAVHCVLYLVPMMSRLHCTCGLCGTVQCTVYLVSMMTCLHCACGLCGTGGADWYYATRTQGDIEQASCGQGCKEKKTK